MANRTVTRWAPQAAKAHRRYRDVPTRVLLGLVETESAGVEGRTSSANAKGLTQFIPGTAAAYHVNTRPGHAQSQLTGAAHYLHDLLKQTGNIRSALVRYSGGATGYPSTVLSRAESYRGAAKRANRGSGGAQGGSSGARGVTTATVTPAQIPQTANTGLAELLAAQIQHPALTSATPPQDPGFSARKSLALPAGYAGVPQSSGQVSQAPTLEQQLSAIGQQASTVLGKPTVTTKTTVRPGQTGGGGGSGGGGHGEVSIAPGANRAGVGVKPVVERFLRHASANAGIPIRVTTGTNHNQMTTTGNVSDHWDGHGADIGVPWLSRKGDRIAAGALIAAGVKPARARAMARRGGLYTLTHNGLRIQVIWKVTGAQNGGEHRNHVHVGVRPA